MAGLEEIMLWLPIPKDETIITVKVQRQNDEVVCYRVARKTPLQDLMLDYCNRKDLAFHQLKFTFDGDKIDPKLSPHDLDMEDQDVIDACLVNNNTISQLNPTQPID